MQDLNIRVPAKWLRRMSIAAVIAVVLIPPAVWAAGGAFTDDDTSVFESNIEWLASAGITRGCNPPDNTQFCPDDNVTRGQMAAFMQRFAQYLGAEDGTPAQADNADTLDGLDSTDLLAAGTIVTTHGPSEWVQNGNYAGAPLYYLRGTALFNESQLSLTSAISVGDTTYGLSGIELCYEANGAASIDNLALVAHLGTGFDSVVNDSTTHSSTSEECITLSNPSPLYADSWGLSLSVSGGVLPADPIADTPTDFVEVFYVKATWEPTTESVVLPS